MIGIYKITSPSGRSYIGRSLNLKQRLNKYKNLFCKDQTFIYNAILKYGWENMRVEILYESKRTKNSNFVLNLLESHAIRSHSTISPNGYNLKSGGDQSILSDHTKKLISIGNLGKKVSFETREKFRQAKLGKKQSLNHRVKLGTEVEMYDITGIYIKSFYAAIEAQRCTGVWNSNIIRCCKGITGQAGGYIWKYKNK